ncbi:MAG TPA: aminotransferase class I/II-fold pyridoxal phosphate-dependent enzyme [Bacteroidetes bacterium]|nr:aminotransferase class I/II-fold pyridoxal phosphate-dependent enzyme [Bacteroidota bacterium]
MRKKIQQLEQTAKQLELEPVKRKKWDDAVQGYAHDFLNNLPQLKGFVKPGKNPAAAILGCPIDGLPKPIEELLAVLKENLHTSGVNPASGGHLGYIPGGGIYPTALGDYLAAVTNEYAGIFFGGPAAVRIENMLLRWMCQLMGYPEGALGNLTSGGSIANLIAFVTARDAKNIRPEKIRKSVIYLTAQVHHCVHKAIRIGGMEAATVRNVPMDAHFRMDAKALAKLVAKDQADGLNPFLVVASAGTTDTGAMDPLNDIADICEAENLWLHVDAAYGGFFILADVDKPGGSTIKDSFKGIERSDSLAIDPHKGLFLSYGLGAVLIKDVQAQATTHRYQANYMQDAISLTEEYSPAELSPELTKHWRGLRMWLPLQLFGTAPFKAALEEKILLTRYFYGEIQKLGFEVGPFPDLSVCMYRYVPEEGDANKFNAQLLDHVQTDGRIFVSSTTIGGVFWMRVAILCFRTHLREIDLLLEMFREGVREIEVNVAAC